MSVSYLVKPYEQYTIIINVIWRARNTRTIRMGITPPTVKKLLCSLKSAKRENNVPMCISSDWNFHHRKVFCSFYNISSSKEHCPDEFPYKHQNLYTLVYNAAITLGYKSLTTYRFSVCTISRQGKSYPRIICIIRQMIMLVTNRSHNLHC